MLLFVLFTIHYFSGKWNPMNKTKYTSLTGKSAGSILKKNNFNTKAFTALDRMSDNMEKTTRDNPEYKMKRQGIIIGIVCLVVMASLTIFLMRRYRQRTEGIFTELIEESLLSSHSEVCQN